MADVERTGSTYKDNSGGTGTNQISSITVPADADMAIVVGQAYNSGSIDFDILCWDAGATQDFTLIIENDQAGVGNGCFAYRMDTNSGDWPGAGSGKTLDFSYDNTPSYGQQTTLFFLTNVNLTTPVIGTDKVDDPETGSTWTNASLGTVGAEDLAIICGSIYHTSIPLGAKPPASGQTIIAEDTNSNNHFAIAEKLNDDTLIIDDLEASNYFGGVAFAILAGAAGPTTRNTKPYRLGENIGMALRIPIH